MRDTSRCYEQERGGGGRGCICGTQFGTRTASSIAIWRLVRSVRRGGKVVQETVAQLGELDAEGRASARLLAQQLTGSGQPRELFEAAAPQAQRIAVRLDRVYLERARRFGAVWLGWKLWCALKLDELCAEQHLRRRLGELDLTRFG